MTTPTIAARYLQVGGTLTFIEDSVTGDVPVLCLHTAGQNGVQWRHTTERLAALGYRVIVPDMPGHGRSEPAPGGPIDDLGDYASWCIELIDALGIDKLFVVGCSIGGRITLDLASRISDRLLGAVAMAADAGGHAGGQNSWTRELEDAGAPSRTDRTYYGTYAVIGKSLSPELRTLIATMHRREDPRVSVSDLIGWGKHDLSTRIAAITCPTHLVVGEDDLWLDPAAVERAAAIIPGARYTLMPGIGHYPMEEITDFADLLVNWLHELSSTQPTRSTDELTAYA